MFYNIICSYIHIFGAKVGIFFDIDKFFCFFLQKYCTNFFAFFCKNTAILA